MLAVPATVAVVVAVFVVVVVVGTISIAVVDVDVAVSGVIFWNADDDVVPTLPDCSIKPPAVGFCLAVAGSVVRSRTVWMIAGCSTDDATLAVTSPISNSFLAVVVDVAIFDCGGDLCDNNG